MRRTTLDSLNRITAAVTAVAFLSLQLFAPLARAEENPLPNWLREENGGWVPTEQAQRMQKADQDLLEFSKPRPPELKPIDIGPLIVSTVNLLSGELLRRRVQWTIDCQHNGSMIQADSSQLRQVLINLIQNAADAMPSGGELKIATQTVNSHLKLTISDTGSGIPPALLPKIFDPFVTTKSDGNGLGLAMVYSILQAHHGSIRADSQPGRGTTFIVSLPL